MKKYYIRKFHNYKYTNEKIFNWTIGTVEK